MKSERQGRERCRILFLVGDLHTGGLQRQLQYVLQAMDRDRFKPGVAVWTYRGSDVHVAPIRALGVPLYGLSGQSRPAKLWAFRRLVKRVQPEVIHSYSFYTNAIARYGASVGGAVAIGSVRNGFEWEKADAGPVIGRLSARWPRYQIFNSHAAAEEARRSRSVFTANVVQVVRNGLDLDRFRPNSRSLAGPLRILGVGSLLPVKRWERLLAVAQYLQAHGVAGTIRIVGDGPMRPFLVEESKRRRVSGRVHFLPYSNDIPALLAESAFLVHTSDSEGCPNAVMEAMACGRAVVATDVGDISRLIEHGESGLISGPDDEETLFQHVAALIRHPDLCSRMGMSARRIAERDFGLQRLVRDTLECYAAAGWKEDGLAATGHDAVDHQQKPSP